MAKPACAYQVGDVRHCMKFSWWNRGIKMPDHGLVKCLNHVEVRQWDGAAQRSFNNTRRVAGTTGLTKWPVCEKVWFAGYGSFANLQSSPFVEVYIQRRMLMSPVYLSRKYFEYPSHGERLGVGPVLDPAIWGASERASHTKSKMRRFNLANIRSVKIRAIL
jgi:hypothetical protein